jgi:hypothetical protein
MTNTSFPIFGVVRDVDNMTPVGSGVSVFIYNKTKDELKSGYDVGNEDLITDGGGQFQGNLGNFPTQWEVGDDIWLSCRSGSKTAMNRFTLADTGGQEINLRLEELEPIMNIVKFLRMRMTDFSTTRANTATMIYPNYPRPQTKLTKTSYPRVSLEKVDEDTEPVGITNNQAARQTIRLKILSVVWAAKSDFQEFTIGDTTYQGSALLDKVSREVSDILREGFYKRPRYTQDPHLQDYYAYISDRNENLEFDEDEGLMKNEIEIQFEYIRQS